MRGLREGTKGYRGVTRSHIVTLCLKLGDLARFSSYYMLSFEIS